MNEENQDQKPNNLGILGNNLTDDELVQWLSYHALMHRIFNKSFGYIEE